MALETADVRKRIRETIDRARREAAERRARNELATDAYNRFRQDILIPVARQVANVLRAEGYAFAVHTPADQVLFASERSRDDFIEFRLDTTGPRPQVVARIEQRKGRETLVEERPLRPGVQIEHITDRDVLDFLADAIEGFVSR
ncbi:MAG TPA: hypothetical protein VIL25_07320 [Vicinamibacterales bacterium]